MLIYMHTNIYTHTQTPTQNPENQIFLKQLDNESQKSLNDYL